MKFARKFLNLLLVFSLLAGLLVPGITVAYADELPVQAASTVANAMTYGGTVPKFTGGTLVTAPNYNLGTNHRLVRYTDIADAATALADYDTALKGEDYELFQRSTIGDCQFATYTKASGTAGVSYEVHYSYLATLGELRISYGAVTYLGSADAIAETEYEAVVEPSVSLIGMSWNATCIVIQLADGSFIVIDGSFGTDKSGSLGTSDSYSYNGGDIPWAWSYAYNAEADMLSLWNFLETHKVGDQAKVTWMITHPDPDHICMPTNFINSFAGRFELDTVVYTFPDVDKVGMTGSNSTAMQGYITNFLSAVTTNFPAANHYVYHSGQKLYLPGCETEFLLAPEDYYVPDAKNLTYGNHCSGAWRFTVGGKTILILGDCEEALCDQMAHEFGDHLASDVVQVAHHGRNGATADLYNLLADDVKVCLWGCTDVAFYHDKARLGTQDGYSFNTILRSSSAAHYTCSRTHTIDLGTLSEISSAKNATLVTTAAAYAGIPDGVATTYLSDIYDTNKVYSHNPDITNTTTEEITENPAFSLDENFDAAGYNGSTPTLYVYNGNNEARTVQKWTGGQTYINTRTLTDGNKGTYTYSDIALGKNGTVFSKGLGGHIANAGAEASSVVYDLSDLSADYFYAVAGLTGKAANKPTISTSAKNSQGKANTYNVTFEVWGSTSTEAFDADTTAFTLLSSSDGVGGWCGVIACNQAGNTVEFNVPVSGYTYLKLVARSNGGNDGGAYAWGGACVYTAGSVVKPITTEADPYAGPYNSTVTYLSDLYDTAKVDHYIYPASGTTPRDFKLDQNFSSRVVIWRGNTSVTPYQFGSSTFNNANTNKNINTPAEGPHAIASPSAIYLGYTGKYFAKGLGGMLSASTGKPASVVYDVSDLNADYFYAVAGLNNFAAYPYGSGNAYNSYGVTFIVYGSKDDTYETASFERLATATDIGGVGKTFNTAEFNVPITGYHFLKLEAVSDGVNNGGDFAWGNACVYSKPSGTTAGKIVRNVSTSGRTSPVADSEWYLSDHYDETYVLSHYVVPGSGTGVRDFKINTNWDGTVYVWDGIGTANGTNRHQITSADTEITITGGTTRIYQPTDIAIGAPAVVYEKGLAGLVSDKGGTPASVVYDISSVSGNRFYALAGITGSGNATSASNRWLTFNVYGSKTGAENDFVLLSKQTTINAFNVAEFDVDIAGINYLKLEAYISDATENTSRSGLSFVWADACVYTADAFEGKVAEIITEDGTLTGRNAQAENLRYLSGETEKSSFVIGYNNNEDAPLSFYKDRNFPLRIKSVGHTSNLDLLSFYTGSTTAKEVYTGDKFGGVRTENGIPYNATDIALGYNGVIFEKGLSAIASPKEKTPANIVYDVSSLDANRFYAVAGLTSRGNQNKSPYTSWTYTFNVYGSLNGTDWTLLSSAEDIKLYYMAEFDVDISGMNYLKLETVTAGTTTYINNNNSYQFNSAFTWADACVYSLPDAAEVVQPAAQAPVPKLAYQNLTLNNSLAVNVFADVDLEAYPSPYVVFSMNDRQETVSFEQATSTPYGYKFSFTDISAEYMLDTVTAELYDRNGQLLHSTQFTVADYCNLLLNQTLNVSTSSMTALQTAQENLVKALLYYGGAAQNYWNRDTKLAVSKMLKTRNTLGNNGTDPYAPAAPEDTDNILARSNGGGVTFVSANVLHYASNCIRVKYRLTDVTGAVTVTVNGETVTPEDNGDGTYYVYTGDLLPTQYANAYTVAVSVDGVEAATLTYSVNCYAYRMVNKTTGVTDTQKALAQALYNYGVCASAYSDLLA